MENNFGFDYHQHLHMLSRDPNLLGFPFDSGYPNAELVRRNIHTIEDFTSRNLPLFPISGLQQLKASEPNNSQNWFHLKPHFQQALAPVSNSAPKERFPASPFDLGHQRSPAIGTAPAPKRFLVFDQSGDKTTLLYTSGVQTPGQFGAYQVPNPPITCNSKDQRDTNNPVRPSLNGENMEDYSRDVMEDEMREDTEELDALLCSDYDSDFSEDDETSTGHSPSTMTDNGTPKLVEETGEEVDSFSVPTKRQKLSDGGDDVPWNGYAASSLKTFTCSALESDAESSCGNSSKQQEEEGSDSRSGNKRSRKEKIQETVSILQSIVPNASRKDAVVVIDEAIRYLKSLKVQAKALGLDAV